MPKHNIKVQNAHFVHQVGKHHDLTILLLIHYQDKYKKRLEEFKKAGFYNGHRHSIHLVLAASPGDWDHREEILEGWPSWLDVTLLEMGSNHPIPKVNGYYFWLKENNISSDWYLRVDDDSITDLGAFIEYANAHYDDLPVHLMTFPLLIKQGLEQFFPYLAEQKIHTPTLSHEHESSMTSRQAMQAVFNCKPATDFLAHTGGEHEQFGDQPLALAMHIAQVPVATNPISSRDFQADCLNLTGGALAHIHYVNWEDTRFTSQLNATLHGERTPLTAEIVSSLLDRPSGFGRCFGVQLGDLTLQQEGTISGGPHENESRWRYHEGVLCLQRPSGLVTTAFSSVLHHADRAWLMGPCLYHPHQHYLQVSV